MDVWCWSTVAQVRAGQHRVTWVGLASCNNQQTNKKAPRLLGCLVQGCWSTSKSWTAQVNLGGTGLLYVTTKLPGRGWPLVTTKLPGRGWPLVTANKKTPRLLGSLVQECSSTSVRDGQPRFTWVGLASCPEDEEPEDRFTPFRPFSAQNGN